MAVLTAVGYQSWNQSYFGGTTGSPSAYALTHLPGIPGVLRLCWFVGEFSVDGGVGLAAERNAIMAR